MANDKKITVSIGQTKKDLKNAAAEAKRGLKLWGASMPLAKRLKFHAAIAQLEISSAVLAKVPCDPPGMTLEFSAPASTIASKAKKRTRRGSR